MVRIGLLSDTHGFLDESLFTHFAACDEIWHAGDIGADVTVWKRLQVFRPLIAVHGNIDTHNIRAHFPEHVHVERAGLRIWITHIGATPPNYTQLINEKMHLHKPDIFVCGHTHILRIMRDKRKCLYVNPGAAGHEGHHHERTALRFCLTAGKVNDMEIIRLGPRGQHKKHSIPPRLRT